VTSTQAERAAASAVYWAQPSRRDDDMILGVFKGMSAGEVAEAREILATGALDYLTDQELLDVMVGLASKVLVQVERKTITATDVTVELDASLGSFSGYLATFARDASGDTITPQALEQTVRDFTEGRRRWLLTDGHSDSAADVVAEVDTAQLDSVGLFITAKWLSSDRAQALRQMTLDGSHLGLSIDYSADSQPDGLGGRVLTRVDVYGGAITNKPMNGQAIITEGKDARGRTVALGAPIVGLYDDLQARHRADPELERKARVVAASWVSPTLAKSIGTEMAYSMVMGAAEAKAHRELQGDPERAAAAAKRDRANEYSYGLQRSMARLAVDGCGVCWSCQIGGGCIHA
jgi:hypothetical protein